MAPPLRERLARWEVGLAGARPVPAGEVYSFVESYLTLQRILVAPLGGRERPVLAVHDPRSSWRSDDDWSGTPAPVLVDPRDVRALANHPALLCLTYLELFGLDARQVQTQLRQLTVDTTGSMQVVPVAERGLVLQGEGARLVPLIAALVEADANAVARRGQGVVAGASPREPGRQAFREAGGHPLGLPPARGSLVLPGEDEIALGWLVDELARLTGLELAMDELTRRRLDRTRQPLASTEPVPAEEVYTFVESLLVAQGIVLGFSAAGQRPVLGVHVPSAVTEAPAALMMEDDRTDELERHPALQCQILLELRHADARQLQTQVRQLLHDNSGWSQVVPLGSRHLVMTGPGSLLGPLVAAVRALDDAAAARVEESATAEGAR